MIHGAINILILSVLLLVVGLWRPNIPLFWLEKPTRFAIIMLFSVMFMVGATMFAEGSRQKQLEEKTELSKKLKTKKETTTATNAPLADIPKIDEEKVATKVLSSQINATDNTNVAEETEKKATVITETLNNETP